MVSKCTVPGEENNAVTEAPGEANNQISDSAHGNGGDKAITDVTTDSDATNSTIEGSGDGNRADFIRISRIVYFIVLLTIVFAA